MATKEEVVSQKAPTFGGTIPLSQAIKINGFIYCSGSVGWNTEANALVEGTITDRTTQALTNLSHVLEAGGSRLDKVVKVNIFITSMADFAAMNAGYEKFFKKPYPARTCVAVKELPLGTDVEIECVAHV